MYASISCYLSVTAFFFNKFFSKDLNYQGRIVQSSIFQDLDYQEGKFTVALLGNIFLSRLTSRLRRIIIGTQFDKLMSKRNKGNAFIPSHFFQKRHPSERTKSANNSSRLEIKTLERLFFDVEQTFVKRLIFFNNHRVTFMVL